MIKMIGRIIILAGIMGVSSMPLLAQYDCGWLPEGGCNECGPYYGSWTLDFCPSLSNTPGLSPSNCPCVEYDKSLPLPTVTAPTYSDGLKEREISYDCSDPTTDYGHISYTVSGVLWDPPLDEADAVGTHSSTAYVNVTSSDQICPDPGRVTIGTYTWTRLGPATSTTATIDFGPFAHGIEGILKQIPAGWSFNDPTLIFTKTIKTTPICCSGGVAAVKTERSGSFSGTVGGTAATPNYPLPITLGIVSVQFTGSGTISLGVSLTSTSDNCPGSVAGHYCITPGVSFTATGSINISVFTSSLFYVTGSLSGGGAWQGSWCYYNLDDSPDPADQTKFKLCYNDIVLTGSYTLLSGATVGLSVIVVNGSCQ